MATSRDTVKSDAMRRFANRETLELIEKSHQEYDKAFSSSLVEQQRQINEAHEEEADRPLTPLTKAIMAGWLRHPP